MGRMTIGYNDFDKEGATVTVPLPDLTSANIDATITAAEALRTALGAVLDGALIRSTFTAKISQHASKDTRATNKAAQRESKCLVRYHDSITFQEATMELPCPDMSLLPDAGDGYFWKLGADDNDPLWDAAVAAMEAIVQPPGNNTAVVTEIIHVGRNR